MIATWDRPIVPAWTVVLAAGVLLAAFLIAPGMAPPLALVIAAGTLLLTAYAAHHWPHATLTAAAVAVVADPQLVPRLLPDAIRTGPIGASEPLLAVTGLVIAIDALRRGTFVPAFRDPVFALGIVFVALAIVSALLNAVPPVVALLGIVMTVDALAVYFVARMVPDGARLARLAVIGVTAAGTVAALFGIGQVVLDPNLLGFPSFEGRFGEGGRITSFLGNPNIIAAVIGLSLPFPLYASRHLADPRWRWAARVALFVLVLALLLSFSRGAWLAVGLGTIIGALILDWRSVGVLAVCIALAWVAATFMPRNLAVSTAPGAAPTPPPALPDILGSTGNRLNYVGGEGDLRMRFIRDGLPVVTDHLLLGVGPGRYGGAAATIIDSPVYDEYDTELFGFRTVHNFWLHLLGEAGALGTAVFLALVVGLLIRFVRAARSAEGLRFVVLAGAATMGLVAGFNSLTEMIFEGNLPVMLLWLVAGAASTLAPVTPLFDRRTAGA